MNIAQSHSRYQMAETVFTGFYPTREADSPCQPNFSLERAYVLTYLFSDLRLVYGVDLLW